MVAIVTSQICIDVSVIRFVAQHTHISPSAKITTANVLYLAFHTMRDIFWLRIFTVVAACCLIPYFYFQTEPLLTPIY